MTRLRLVTGETFKSLSVRNFRLFFVGQGISQIGNWLTLVAQTLLVLTLTKSGIALGVLAAAQFGPVLILGPWAGLIADRSDKRKLLMTVQTIAMFQSFALATLAFIGNPPVLAVYGVALIGGVTVAFDNPARRSFVVEMVPTDDMTNAVSLNSALMTSSRVIGPALAGLLVTTVGFGWAFLLDGLSYIAVLISLFMIRSNELNAAPVTPKAKGQVRAGLRYARSVPDLWVPLVMMAIVGTLSFNFQVVFPLVVTRDFGGNDASFTILLSVVSVGSLIGALAAARRKAVSIRWVALTAVIFGAALTLMAFASVDVGGLPDRIVRGPRQHRVHDGLHRDHADPVGPADARSGAGAPGNGVPRVDADRGSDRRLDRRGVRRPVVRRSRGRRGPRSRVVGPERGSAHRARRRRIGGRGPGPPRRSLNRRDIGSLRSTDRPPHDPSR